MGIKLDISAETPLSDDGRDILAGISVMLLAIANRQNLADQPQMREEDELEDMEPAPRGSLSKDEPARYCIREPGHTGRHKSRPMNGLVNYATRGLAGCPPARHLALDRRVAAA